MKSLYSAYFFNRFTLQFFDNEVEQYYWESSYKREVFLYRIFISICLVIPIFYSFLDWFISKGELPSIFYFRLFVTCPLIMVSVAITYIKPFKNSKSLQIILFVSLLIVGITYISFTLFYASNTIFAVNSAIAILLIGSVLFNLKLKLYILLDLSFMTVFFYYLSSNQLSYSTFFSENRLLLIFALITIFIRFRTEKNNRTQFIKSEILKVQNDEIVKHKNELENLNNVKDKLFSIIAHDLKHPLDSLKGVLTLLKASVLTKEEIEEIIEKLDNEINNTKDLLSNLLSWARAHLKGIEVHEEEIDLSGLSSKITNLLKPLSDKKGVALYNQISSEIIIEADIDMIKFVVRNLISNAIKFTNKGDTIKIYESHNKETVTLFIEDTGIGMNKEILDKIFTESVPSTMGTAKEIGTGLGLALCKEFIEKNNGSINVNSQLGEGSIFSFEMPLKKKNKS